MTPESFIKTWQANTRNEAAGSKPHFLDLCALLDVPPPHSDPTGTTYAFEKGVKKAAGGGGWADVWKRGCFGWEYKARGGDLEKAHDQLLRYAGALENPPLLITSDMDRIIVRTNWTNAVSERREFSLEDLRHPQVRALLKACWTDPDRWRPAVTRQALTEKAAGDFAELARRLRERGHAPQIVAHFVNRLVFCLFADDVGLLPDRLLSDMLTFATKAPAHFAGAASELFRAMRDRGGRVGFQPVQWFNGGLFDDDTALPLEGADIALLARVAALDWADVDPSIFGTLFERGLDPDKRSQLGAHYTDREKIGLLVDAVVVRPLLAEWEAARGRIAAAMDERAALKRTATKSLIAANLIDDAGITQETLARKSKLRRETQRQSRSAAALLAEAQASYVGFIDRLRAFRVLDPACGSGNFLYMSLLALKDMELRVSIDAEVFGLDPALPLIGPECVLGIEINPYAAELARVSVWIGHIQWARRNGFPPPSNPVLRSLDTIECRDAVLAPNGQPANWPNANVIIGNPPYLGMKKQLSVLGAEYTQKLRQAYDGRIPAASDLVCYWFELARSLIASGVSERAGLVAEQNIKSGYSRFVLDRIKDMTRIYDAWSNQLWALNGADVRVSLICFGKAEGIACRLDGAEVERINSDLSASAADLTTSRRIPENVGIAFSGTVKGGKLDVDSKDARKWLAQAPNANGRPNSDVLLPWVNASDVTGRSRDKWIIDFGNGTHHSEAAYYAAPFAYVVNTVKPVKEKSTKYGSRWWLLSEWCPGLRAALAPFTRYIATPTGSSHRLFVWLDAKVQPDHQLVAIARDDDTTFGILHSRFHEAWTRRKSSSIGVGDDPRYNPATVFETFPFPDDLTPNIPAADYASHPHAQPIAAAARALVEARDRWLNPPELVNQVPEVVPGFPDRLVSKNEDAASTLKKRTLTVLYNTRGTPEGTWLDNLHRVLDDAVAAAYGWPANITTDDALARLLALNHARSAAEAAAA
jgi:type II restriction/modification system DNA methylase subunit YeeA